MNEITLSGDIKQIELEINHHKNIAGQSIWEIGRRLNHVKENDLAHGEFIEWVETVGIEYREANRMMKVAKEIPNMTTLSHLGSSALYLIAKLPEEERTKEHTTEKGETKTPDEMTVKELQQLNKRVKLQLEIINQKNDTINKQAEEVRKLRQQEPKIVTETVEVVPEDYEQLKRTTEQLQNRNGHLEKEHQKLLDERKNVDEKSKKYDQLNEAIEQSQGKLNQTQKTISNYNNLHKLLKESNEFLTKASTLIYSEVSEVIQKDVLAKQELNYLLSRLERFNRDINNLLSQEIILEGEIINE